MLAQMAEQTGMSRESVIALVQSVRPLEFYMPVEEHRSAWRGAASLVVASQLDESSTPVGYDLDGQTVRLSLEAAPATPTLALVPVETQFPDGDAAFATNAECADCAIEDAATSSASGQVAAAAADPNAGIYMTRMRVKDKRESWPRGDAEIEVHVRGTQYGFWTLQPPPFPGAAIPGVQYNPTYRNLLGASCAGERQQAPKRFNISTHGTREGLNIMLARATDFRVEEVLRYNENTQAYATLDKLDPPINFVVVERDDDHACPTAPRDMPGFRVGVSYNFASGNAWYRSLGATGVDGGLWNALTGGNNDWMGGGSLYSWAEVEATNNTPIVNSRYVEISIASRGFSNVAIPPQVDPYYQY